MKSFTPLSMHNGWQASRGRLSGSMTSTRTITPRFCPLRQQAAKRAAYCTRPFAGDASQSGAMLHQPPQRRAIDRRRSQCVQHPGYHTQPCLSPARGRAPYSTETHSGRQPVIHNQFELFTSTWQYVVADPSSSTAVLIDPVLNYDPATQAVTTKSAESLLSLIKERGYKIDRILETHAHADHLTSASYLQRRLAQIQGHKPPICIGKRIGQVQKLFGHRYGVPTEEYEGAFDKLFDDDETFDIGRLKATAIHLPGHTPDHLGYMIGDNVFCGDSIFHADIGTARCDFPGGSAKDLYSSTRKLLSLPDHVKIWTGHDYPPRNRDLPSASTTVGDHKAQNKHIKDAISEEDFVALRGERDAQLGEPKLLHQSLQINIRAGKLPKPTESGHRLLHLPLKLKAVEW